MINKLLSLFFPQADNSDEIVSVQRKQVEKELKKLEKKTKILEQIAYDGHITRDILRATGAIKK